MSGPNVRDEMRRLRVEARATPRTVKVRIAVAVAEDGTAEATVRGTDGETPLESARRWLLEDGHIPVAAHYVTATLPVPEPVEVEGVVERADDTAEMSRRMREDPNYGMTGPYKPDRRGELYVPKLPEDTP